MMEMMMAMALNTYFDFKVLIHWLTNRTNAKPSGKAFYNDFEVMAGDCFCSTEWSTMSFYLSLMNPLIKINVI